MIIQSVFVVIGLIVATILGVFGQDISYYLNAQFPIIKLITSLTFVTFLSIGMYIIIPVLLFISKKVKKELFKISFIVCISVGLPISMWSFFVWAMWMG